MFSLDRAFNNLTIPVMWSDSKEIAAGDLAIAWLTRDIIQPFVVDPVKDLNSRYGYYRHIDLIGLPYGSKVGSRNGKGFIHVLRPTPELWTLALPHRTQILYLADISFITSWLNIRPGSVVIEAGTGSGSFTHSIARTVGPTGRIFTYEFHEARATKAREEFARHGMSDVVTLTHRNVCKDGFTIENSADSVFLDLPAPWDAVEHAKSALRKDRTTRICCFSPCMEQVLRTVTSLNDAGFTEITMYETLIRPHEVSQVSALPSVASVSERIKQSERKREDKRLRQMAAARAKHAEKRKRGDVEQEEVEADVRASDMKKAKTDDGVDAAASGFDQDLFTPEPVSASALSISALTNAHPASSDTLVITPGGAQVTAGGQPTVVSRVVPEVRGHTSYLTFGLLLSRATQHAAAATKGNGQEDALLGISTQVSDHISETDGEHGA